MDKQPDDKYTAINQFVLDHTQMLRFIIKKLCFRKNPASLVFDGETGVFKPYHGMNNTFETISFVNRSMDIPDKSLTVNDKVKYSKRFGKYVDKQFGGTKFNPVQLVMLLKMFD